MVMMVYKALDDRDRFVSGEIDDVTRDAAALKLARNGLQVLALEQASKPKSIALGTSIGGFGVSERDITGILRDLGMLLRSGLVLDDSLQLLSDGASRPVARLLGQLRQRVLEGHALSDALQRHLPRPSPALVAIVRIAELSGKLDRVLETIAEERTGLEATSDKLASALRYPAFLLLLSCGILVFFMIFVVPQFADVIRDFKTPTSGLIGLVLAGSDLMVHSGDIVGAAALAIVVFLFLIFRLEATRIPLQRSLSRLPGINAIVSHKRTAQFCNAISLLVENGVTLVDALKVLAESAAIEQAELRHIYERVRRGGRLADALSQSQYLTPLAIHMLRVGEESGEFARVARRTGAFNEAKLAQKIDRLTAIAGPLAIVFISTIVGGLIVSIMTTLLSLNQVAL